MDEGEEDEKEEEEEKDESVEAVEGRGNEPTKCETIGTPSDEEEEDEVDDKEYEVDEDDEVEEEAEAGRGNGSTKGERRGRMRRGSILQRVSSKNCSHHSRMTKWAATRKY